MKKRPILITQRILENQSYPEIRDALDVRWADFLYNIDLLPIPIPSHANPLEYIDQCNPSGIILSGGNSLNHLEPDSLSNIRDLHESKILEIAQTKQIPVLGVCRGLQLLCHSFGMKLEKVQNHASTRHNLIFDNQPGPFAVYPEIMETNSFHDYSVVKQQSSPDLVIVAHSEDGNIEAVHHKQLPFAGIMWHPERETPFNPQDLKFFKEIFKEKSKQ